MVFLVFEPLKKCLIFIVVGTRYGSYFTDSNGTGMRHGTGCLKASQDRILTPRKFFPGRLSRKGCQGFTIF